jgi:hypothetical protein
MRRGPETPPELLVDPVPTLLPPDLVPSAVPFAIRLPASPPAASVPGTLLDET